MTALQKPKPRMTVEEFFDWDGGGHVGKLELVHGVVRAQSYASSGHGTIQGTLAALICNHLRAQGKGSRVGIAVGVIPTFDPTHNVRKPDLSVTCTPHKPGERVYPKPILAVEVLSPSDQDETWESIQACSTIGSVKEILVVDSEQVDVRVFTRDANGIWPEDPAVFARGATLHVASIGLDVLVDEIYEGLSLP